MYPVLVSLSANYSRHQGRLFTRYSPVRHSTRGPKTTFAFDLHVLSTPPAFVLSQDQTLQLNFPMRQKPSPLVFSNSARCTVWSFSCMPAGTWDYPASGRTGSLLPRCQRPTPFRRNCVCSSTISRCQSPRNSSTQLCQRISSGR